MNNLQRGLCAAARWRAELPLQFIKSLPPSKGSRSCWWEESRLERADIMPRPLAAFILIKSQADDTHTSTHVTAVSAPTVPSFWMIQI